MPYGGLRIQYLFVTQKTTLIMVLLFFALSLVLLVICSRVCAPLGDDATQSGIARQLCTVECIDFD